MADKKHFNRILAFMLSILLALGNFFGDWPVVQAANADHDHSGYTAWKDTSAMPQTAGSYYLDVDVALSSEWQVPSGRTNLCLNGHTISQGEASGQRVVTIPSGAELYLYDETDKGKITGGVAEEGGGVRVDAGGTFVMDGGTITENQATYDLGGGSGGGVCVYGGTFTMNGGVISGNTALMQHGGGVAVKYSGTFTMNGGEITKNLADNQYTNRSGGGLYVDSSSSATMNGGKISGNTATSSGGGVHTDGTFTMNGGEISGNTAEATNSTDEGGGGVGNSKEFIFNGGTITGNKAKYGGGVLYSWSGSRSMQISGKAVIYGNTDLDGAQNNVWLGEGKVITVAGDLTSGAQIGISVEGLGTAGSAIDITGANSKDYSGFFKADNTKNAIKNNANTVQLILGEGTGEGGGSVTAAFEGSGTAEDPYRITGRNDLKKRSLAVLGGEN